MYIDYNNYSYGLLFSAQSVNFGADPTDSVGSVCFDIEDGEKEMQIVVVDEAAAGDSIGSEWFWPQEELFINTFYI